MPKGEKSIYIDAPFELIYDFCRNPQNWSETPLGIPSESEVVGTGDVGTRASFSLSIAGKMIPSILEITETLITDHGFKTKYKLFSESNGKENWAVQTEKGEAKGFGCDYKVEYEYKLPDNLFTDSAEKQKFEEQTGKELEQSMVKLKGLCEALK
jgi:hypothetical protein